MTRGTSIQQKLVILNKLELRREPWLDFHVYFKCPVSWSLLFTEENQS